ncbi:MAG: hypothetical protein HYR85_15945 [Planctomycetes bacterium]|nr:hypothetical protein [Planctomycetota bacterium]
MLHRSAVVIAFALALVSGRPANVLANGGFEKGLDGWLRFDTTKQGKVEIVDDAH